MPPISSQSATDETRHLRMQQGALLAVAALALAIGWLDGISGFIDAMESIQKKSDLVRITTRWHFSAGLLLVTLVTLTLAAIAYCRQQLFDLKTLVVSGAVTAGMICAFSILLMLGFYDWAEAQGYERCYERDRILGVTRHGNPNVDISAWTPVGQCRSK